MPLQSNRVKAYDITWRDNIKTATNPRPKDIVMNKKITTQELHNEIDQVKREISLIKDNHLMHLEKSVSGLQSDVKDNRRYFDDRLNKLDHKIWTLVLLTLGTLASSLLSMMI